MSARIAYDAPDKTGFRWPDQARCEAIERGFADRHLARFYMEAYAHPAYQARLRPGHEKWFREYMRYEVRDCVRRLAWKRLGGAEERFLCEYSKAERRQIVEIIAPMSFDEIREGARL